MIIDISVAVIALAFLGLVIYLISMIKSLRTTLGHVNQTLVEGRKQLEEIGPEAKKIIEHANQMSVDIQGKMKALNSVFNTVSNVGEFLEEKTEPLASHSVADEDFIETSFKSSKKPELIKVAEILELAGLGVRLWQKYKKRR